MKKMFRVLPALMLVIVFALAPLSNTVVMAAAGISDLGVIELTSEEPVSPVDLALPQLQELNAVIVAEEPVENVQPADEEKVSEIAVLQGQVGTTLSATINGMGYWKQVYDWSILKTGDSGPFVVKPGEFVDVNYQVVVTPMVTHESFGVSGRICVTNGGEVGTENLSVTAQVQSKSGGGQFQDVAGGVAPVAISELAAGAIGCGNYNISFTPVIGAEYRIVANISITNHSGNLGDAFGPSPKTDFSLPAAPTVLDGCVTVSDSQTGVLGTVCAGDLVKTFSYTIQVGRYAECGTYQFTNTASYLKVNTQKGGASSWMVEIQVPCEEDKGCTLTPGYWKTHSSYGPAPYDDNWVQVGEDTVFFLSGQSWYNVLWTTPAGGNAYYILAHAYIAAHLNQLNGAAVPAEVSTALTFAVSFFNTYEPGSTLTRSVRNSAISNAEILDNYNNGLIGPGHCSF
jgi:hypothetical protein